jgi:hypothetical protein
MRQSPRCRHRHDHPFNNPLDAHNSTFALGRWAAENAGWLFSQEGLIVARFAGPEGHLVGLIQSAA